MLVSSPFFTVDFHFPPPTTLTPRTLRVGLCLGPRVSVRSGLSGGQVLQKPVSTAVEQQLEYGDVRDAVVPHSLHPALPLRPRDAGMGHVLARGLQGLLPRFPGALQVRFRYVCLIWGGGAGRGGHVCLCVSVYVCMYACLVNLVFASWHRMPEDYDFLLCRKRFLPIFFLFFFFLLLSFSFLHA